MSTSWTRFAAAEAEVSSIGVSRSNWIHERANVRERLLPAKAKMASPLKGAENAISQICNPTTQQQPYGDNSVKLRLRLRSRLTGCGKLFLAPGAAGRIVEGSLAFYPQPNA